MTSGLMVTDNCDEVIKENEGQNSYAGKYISAVRCTKKIKTFSKKKIAGS